MLFFRTKAFWPWKNEVQNIMLNMRQVHCDEKIDAGEWYMVFQQKELMHGLIPFMKWVYVNKS